MFDINDLVTELNSPVSFCGGGEGGGEGDGPSDAVCDNISAASMALGTVSVATAVGGLVPSPASPALGIASAATGAAGLAAGMVGYGIGCGR